MIYTTEGYLRNACNTRNKQIKTTVKQTMQLMFRDNETIDAKKPVLHCTVQWNRTMELHIAPYITIQLLYV